MLLSCAGLSVVFTLIRPEAWTSRGWAVPLLSKPIDPATSIVMLVAFRSGDNGLLTSRFETPGPDNLDARRISPVPALT